MQCSHCGNLVAEHSAACPYCGTMFSAFSPAVAAQADYLARVYQQQKKQAASAAVGWCLLGVVVTLMFALLEVMFPLRLVTAASVGGPKMPQGFQLLYIFCWVFTAMALLLLLIAAILAAAKHPQPVLVYIPLGMLAFHAVLWVFGAMFGILNRTAYPDFRWGWVVTVFVLLLLTFAVYLKALHQLRSQRNINHTVPAVHTVPVYAQQGYVMPQQPVYPQPAAATPTAWAATQPTVPVQQGSAANPLYPTHVPNGQQAGVFNPPASLPQQMPAAGSTTQGPHHEE